MTDRLKKESTISNSEKMGAELNKVVVRVPGSSANLGPGFDTLGLALSVYATLTFTLVPKEEESVPFVTASGTDQKSLDAGISRLLFHLVHERIKPDPQIIKRLRVNINSQIPVGRGFGSSAALVLATLWATDRLCQRPIDRNDLLSRATAIEGHPDNAAASLFGGLTVSSFKEDGTTVIAEKLHWPEQWHLLLVVPEHQVPTSKSRIALPADVSRQDAVYNLQHLALLMTAIQNKNENLLKEALSDRLHEPYRAPLVPEMGKLKELLRGGSALGCVLSGSGSSVLVIANEREKRDLLKQISSWLKHEGSQSNILDLTADQKGLQELND